MAQIIPAILPESFQELREKAEIVVHGVSVVQLDICDGKFVPSKTWPYGNKDDKDFLKILEETQGLPASDILDYEIDLMTSDPLSDADAWIRAGASRLIIHAESTNDLDALIPRIKEEMTMPGSVAEVDLGVALGSGTPLSIIEKIIPYISVVQVMGIKRIGFQHMPFDDSTYKRIEELKNKYPEVLVSVDGGVSKDNASKLLSAGADRLVIGSAIFESGNPLSTIEYFESL
ncbi:MAG: hypothetical protein AAB597_02460 [Patescibacteria group bacterium]